MTPEKKYSDQALLFALLLERLAAGMNYQYVRRLRSLEGKILSALSNEFPRGMKFANEARLQRLIKEVRALILEIFNEIQSDYENQIVGVVETASDREKVLFLLAFGLKLESLPTDRLKAIASKYLIDGTTAKDWFGRIAGDLLFRFNATARLAARNKSDLPDAIKRVAGSKEATFKDALITKTEQSLESTVRSGVAASVGNVKLETYRVNGEKVNALQQISVLDERTSKICIAYAWKVWDLKGNPIGHDLPFNDGTPRHFNCRSIIIPIVLGQVEKTDIDEWLDSLSNKDLNHALGVGVAEYFRQGKITARDLVDSTHRKPITLRELKSKFATQ